MITTLLVMMSDVVHNDYDVVGNDYYVGGNDYDVVGIMITTFVGVVGNDYDVLPGTQLECASWWNPS